MDNKRLIEKCSKGNHKAQKTFFHQYIDILYATINRYIKDSSTTDDILFQGMMKIFSELENFNYINEKALIGWLKKIVINEALMFLRSDFRTLYKVEEISGVNFIISDSQFVIVETGTINKLVLSFLISFKY